MADSLKDRLRHAWNAFKDSDKDVKKIPDDEPGFYFRPDRPMRRYNGSERTIINAIYTRIAIDVAATEIKHVKLDEQDRYISDVNSGLNYCLRKKANIDQTGRAFIQDAVYSMLDEGCIAIVPMDADIDPYESGSYDIKTLRCGRIVEWRPSSVVVEVYNGLKGVRERIPYAKSVCAIIQNPFYEVMNSPNSTLQRLIRKLAMLDQVDEDNLGKLQMIVQLPYVVKGELRKQQAEKRRKEIEEQLVDSKYGIAYTDGTEKITQINRPLENNLMGQIEFLTDQLYSQLSITPEILNGTADERQMLNYNNRTIEPIVASIAMSMEMAFLTKTAQTQHQAIRYFSNPFRLVPMSQMAELADKLTRNEIATSNEIRQFMGLKPADDPKADMLINSNLNHPEETGMPNNNFGNNNDLLSKDPAEMTDEELEEALRLIEENENQLDELEGQLDAES